MSQIPLYPLRFEPIYQYRPWGGRRLADVLTGTGQVEHDGATYAFGKDDVFLLPAVAGECAFQPRSAVSLLEIALPE